VMDLAERVVDDATAIAEADLQRLRDLGRRARTPHLLAGGTADGLYAAGTAAGRRDSAQASSARSARP
jgi:hypothetical protein